MSEVNEMKQRAQESVKLLTVQIDALIRRVAAKDEEFAKERRVLKASNAKLLTELKSARAELRKLKPAAKRTTPNGF